MQNKKAKNNVTKQDISQQDSKVEMGAEANKFVSVERQLEAFADLLIDHFLKQCHDKK